VTKNGNAVTLASPPVPTVSSAWMSIVSKATVTTIGLASKLFLNSGYCSSVKVNGIHNLLSELSRKDGRGVITGAFVSRNYLKVFVRLTRRPSVANHLST